MSEFTTGYMQFGERRRPYVCWIKTEGDPSATKLFVQHYSSYHI